MTQYPRDEFDRVPESAARQGVHRERIVPPRTGGLVFKIVAGLLVLAVGLAAYFLFPRLGIGQASEVSAGTAVIPTAPVTAEEAAEAAEADPVGESASEEPEEQQEPSAEPSEDGTAEVDAVPSEEPSEEPSPEPEPTEAAAVVDRSQPVTVLNATTVSGLAGTAAGRLQSDGWTVGQIGNWSGQQLQGSIVLYNGEEQRATAEALAAVLGIPTVQGNSGLAGGVTAVVGPGFQ